jgi:hypothetical protein
MTDENTPTGNSGHENDGARDKIKSRMTRGSFYPTAAHPKHHGPARAGRRPWQHFLD